MKKVKNRFEIITSEEDFQIKVEEQHKDDIELAELLSNLADKNMHKQFNFALLNLGTLMQTISVFFDLKQNEIEKILKLEKEQIKQRKITIIINEINEKINLKYDLDEETTIIKEIFAYDNESYIKINKTLFIQLLFGKGIIDITNMDNI